MNLFKKKYSDMPRRRLVERDTNVPASSSDIFRRNRTITGTTSNYLNAMITESNSNLESPRVHAHSLSSRRRKIFSVLLAIMLIASCIWFIISHFTAMPTITIEDISVAKKIDDTPYIETIQDYLNINPMERMRFLLNESALDSYVSNRMPEVESVNQHDTLSIGKTNFVIKMRLPVAGWNINDKQYYVDSNGITFEKNYFTMPIIQIVDNSGVLPQTGAVIASKRFLGFVGRVVSIAKTDGYTVTKATLPVNTTRQLEIYLDGYVYPIKLSIDRLAGEQVEDMVRAVQYFTNRGQSPSYVDVRVSGKAFYK